MASVGAASTQDAADPTPVSVVSLIANPAAYEGRRVSVTGYLTTAHFEDCAVYLGKDDFDRQIAQNAVRLDWKQCLQPIARTATSWSIMSGRYASIEGTFRRGSTLDRGRYYAGVIGDVTKVRPAPSRLEFANQLTMPWWREYLIPMALALIFVALVTTAAAWITRTIQRSR